MIGLGVFDGGMMMKTGDAGRTILTLSSLVIMAGLWAGCRGAEKSAAAWEQENPVRALPAPPLGNEADFSSLKFEVTPEKVRLGRWLFFDGRLSADGTVSCASCHRPGQAFSEPTPHSTGVGGAQGGRKAPTVINTAWPLYDVYFWDGRAHSLQEQAKGPMINPVEMANTHERVVATLQGLAGYRKAFKEVYGDEAIDIDRVVDAIAAYEATRLSGDSPWDRFQAGDKAALTPRQKEGNDLFFGKAECAQCHLGWNFTDSMFHNLGIGWNARTRQFADPGRAKITGDEKETGRFKTPTLREVALHAPYMHDGSLATLHDVVEHYNKGGIPNPWLSERIRPLNLTPEEIDALVSLLEALSGEGYADTPPRSFPM
ncbi:MAG: cytochrome-c peroxidase [Acidobacteriota bacterium]